MYFCSILQIIGPEGPEGPEGPAGSPGPQVIYSFPFSYEVSNMYMYMFLYVSNMYYANNMFFSLKFCVLTFDAIIW